jgi:hypothetical protein
MYAWLTFCGSPEVAQSFAGFGVVELVDEGVQVVFGRHASLPKYGTRRRFKWAEGLGRGRRQSHRSA